MVYTHFSPRNEPLTSEQAAQITTVTSELRDITKMERIGGRFDVVMFGKFLSRIRRRSFECLRARTRRPVRAKG